MNQSEIKERVTEAMSALVNLQSDMMAGRRKGYEVSELRDVIAMLRSLAAELDKERD
ncbi:hypothetical protein QBK93_17425 [Rhizobium leguminosarum]|uniref:hypothetical protein n=1 Tax=Rhizobium leguminosarum TaxID=384 RepID=UPI0024A80018|nr:hypothetical protein [Rhizobium leguminosarum]MDI5926460.1 hypothetical protein [Rhizobium leguminosarum]